MENLIGRSLGQYQILEEIGRGGMGAVYKALDPLLRLEVAIKILAPHLSWSKDFVQRFLREAQGAARLRHPNIVTIHGVGHVGELYYFVMEYIPGLSLAALLRERGPLPPTQVSALVEQVAAALDYAHGRGLVHRDVKSSNIIVTPEGQAILTDFGIARAAEGTRLTDTGATMGTPEYMAPEQAQGEEATPASDRYALGIMVYEMLTGHVPFTATTPLAVLMKHVTTAPPPLRQFNRHVPEAAEQTVLWALAKDPAARPPTGAAFAAALRRALLGEDVSPPPTVGSAPSVRRPTTRRRWVWAIPAIVVIVVVALLGVLLGPDLLATPAAQPTAARAPTTGVMVAQEPSPDPSPPGATTLAPTTVPARATSTPSPTGTPGAQVTAAAANLRAGPGVEYGRVGQLAQSDWVAVIAWARSTTGQRWLLVRPPDGAWSWISASLVTENDASRAVPAAATVPPTPRAVPTLAPPTGTPTSPAGPTPVPSATEPPERPTRESRPTVPTPPLPPTLPPQTVPPPRLTTEPTPYPRP